VRVSLWARGLTTEIGKPTTNTGIAVSLLIGTRNAVDWFALNDLGLLEHRAVLVWYPRALALQAEPTLAILNRI
jgi:hypothetical protein